MRCPSTPPSSSATGPTPSSGERARTSALSFALSNIDDPSALRGELLLVDEQLGDEEWLASDLLHCSVPGHGRVVRVIDGPSCSVLELSDGVLVPFVTDAIRSVRPGEIVVNEDFLG